MSADRSNPFADAVAPLARAHDLAVAALVPHVGNLPADVGDRVRAALPPEEVAALVIAAVLAIPLEAARADVAASRSLAALLDVDPKKAAAN